MPAAYLLSPADKENVELHAIHAILARPIIALCGCNMVEDIVCPLRNDTFMFNALISMYTPAPRRYGK